MENRFIFDAQTFSAAGPFTLNTKAIEQAAEQPVPGQPDKAWGLKSIILECNHTIAALSAQGGATPGKRVQEILDNLEIQLNGEDGPACTAGGRALAELLRLRRGKLAFANPADLADADGTLTPRYVHEFSWMDERLEDPEEFVKHAAALRHIKCRFNTALVTGISLTSVTVTAIAVLVPIDKGKVGGALQLKEEVLGNGVASIVSADLPAADGLLDMWLHFSGTLASTGPRPQFLETVDLTVDLGGRRVHDRTVIASLIESYDAQYTTDAAGEESSSAPEVVHLVSAPFRGMKMSHAIQSPRGGKLKASASMSDSGNAATVVPWVVTYGVRAVHPESAQAAAYLGAIKNTHFPTAKAFAEVARTLDGKSSIPRRIAGLTTRTAIPVK